MSRRLKVAAIVVNWNNPTDTIRCVDSLWIALKNVDGRVIVVDNGSTDNSVGILRNVRAELIESDRNEGFARGVNRGLDGLGNSSLDFLVLLNNDAWVRADAIDAAISSIISKSLDLVSGKIYADQDSSHISYAGGRISKLLGRAIVPSEGKRERPEDSVSKPTRFVTCAFLVARWSAFAQIGARLPDEYFFGTEEWDLSETARRNGLRLWYEPAAVAWHMGARSHPESSARWVYSSYRNKLIFQRKFLPRVAYVLWLAVFRLYISSVMPRLRTPLHGGAMTSGTLRACASAALRDHTTSARVELEQLESADRLMGCS